MRTHDTAVRMIEQVLNEYPSAPYPAMTEASALMGIEMAYSLGAIGETEHKRYSERLRRMTDRTPQRIRA
ncbi:hypothetical protein D3C76_845570 [compost metagenome]